jgi:hypothetical protein
VDHEHGVRQFNNDELEEVACSVGPGHQISVGIVAEFHPGDGVLVSMGDVCARNLVAVSRRMDLHLISVIQLIGVWEEAPAHKRSRHAAT